VIRRPALSDRARLLLACAAALAVVVPLAWLWWSSRIPDTYDIAEMGYADYGGGARAGHDHDHHGTAVADLVEKETGPPHVAVTLTVAKDGDRYTVNGQSPGPEIRATQGDLVEVTLVNDNITAGTALHWHGIDVPNAMDGVAGVTQDAVEPDESFVYRFVARQSGTYWYHSHQVSHDQVRRGLLGALVVQPAEPSGPAAVEHVAVLHRYGTKATLNGERGTSTVAATPGDAVRVRVVNTDNGLTPVWVTGAPYRVLAVDGTDVHEPDEVERAAVKVPPGGRVDLGLVVPEGGARVDFGSGVALVLGEDPAHGEDPSSPGQFVDLLSYGSPAPLGFDPDDADRHFEYRIGRRLGFLDGKPGRWWTINGHKFPDVPMYMVDEGDVVVFEIENHSGESHPMHLHGHHVVVLSRDGKAASGSPWWVDSLEVGNGESYEVAFVGNNPGIWMDHCHNLPHATQGLVAHLMYSGVTSSYEIGGHADNAPE
jgi:FtsP/CotA-like multicopper oxidase with cupredoxin domain